MKYPLKKRVIIAAVLLIVIPICVIFISYRYAAAQFESNSYFTYNTSRVLTNPIIEDIEKNFGIIRDYESFSKAILPGLQSMECSLQVINLEGAILYDSSDRYAIGSLVDPGSYFQFDEYFHSRNPGLFRVSYPIIAGGSQVGNAVFIIPSNRLTASPGEKSARLVAPMAIGLGVIILFTVSMLFIITRSLLIPVRDLKLSAYEISKGSFDTQLKYKGSNELGDVFTAFETMREELKDSVDRQAGYESAHKQLIASISHDLKTPISSIKASVDALEDGLAKDPENFNRYVSVIKKKTDSLTKLIEDLFQHSQMQLQKLKINLEEQYSQQAFKSILEPLRMQFKGTNIEFRVKEPLPDVLVSIDASRIEQVVVNMVQNARKHMSEGGTIEFEASQGEDYIKVSISDTGLGISPEDIPHIFDPFYRGEKARTSGMEGAGLGLSICKYIVEEHGGEISVKSTCGKGTVFSFTIPKV
jgi:signal transduction histidine kinase